MKEEGSELKTLNELIKEAGFSLSDIAEALGYNRATIRDRKNNPEHMTLEELIIIARLLKKTPTAVLKTLMRDMQTGEVNIMEELLKVADQYLGKKK